MNNLSTRQFEIMDILWKSETPMIASQIMDADEELNINTVQAVLRALTKKSYIEQAEIVYSGTVLARSYRPIVSKEDYLQSLGGDCQKVLVSNSLQLIALIRNEKDIKVLEELEKVIQETMKKLKG